MNPQSTQRTETTLCCDFVLCMNKTASTDLDFLDMQLMSRFLLLLVGNERFAGRKSAKETTISPNKTPETIVVQDLSGPFIHLQWL